MRRNYFTADPQCHVVLKDTPTEARSEMKEVITANKRQMRGECKAWKIHVSNQLHHNQASVCHQLPELTQIHVHWVDDGIQPSHPLSSPSPPTFNLPSIRVFSNESVLRISWPKYWSFSFISPSNEYSGLISFRMDWLDLLAVQGTLKSLLQHHSSKAHFTFKSL